MKKLGFLFALVIGLQILDNTIVNEFAIFGYRPSLLFVFIVCYSIIWGKEEAFFIALFGGAIQDLYYLNSFGLNMVTNLVICMLAAIIGENLFTEKKLIPIIIIFLSSLLKDVLNLFFLFINGYYLSIQREFFNSLYNFAIAYFIYTLALKLSKSTFMVKRWRF